MPRKNLAQRSHTMRTNPPLVHFSYFFVPALLAWALSCFCPSGDHTQSCAFLNWDVSSTQGGRFNDKDFARWQMGVKQNISSWRLACQLLWSLAGDSLKGRFKELERRAGGWLSSTHHSLLCVPPRHSEGVTVYQGWVQGPLLSRFWQETDSGYLWWTQPVAMSFLGLQHPFGPLGLLQFQSLPLIRIQQAELN